MPESISALHDTVVHLGSQRGSPRYFVNTRYLERAGFRHGQWLSIRIGDGTLTVRVTSEPTGKRCQEKDGRPLIDLNAKFLRDVFGEAKALHVRVCPEEITLSVHPIAQAERTRPADRGMGSIFAGAGLLDQAGVQAGFTAKWAIEIDRRIADVYADNHPGATIFEMSAHEAAFADLSPVELLLLGLPCQPWSRVRTLNGDGSKRDHSRPATEHPLGDMAIWALLIILRANPRTVVLECAPGFADGELHASFCGALRRLGYAVDTKVLNTHEYGALTKRRRTVLIATTPAADGSTPNPWPEPLPASAPKPTFAEMLDKDVPDDLWWDRISKPWVFAINERNAAKGNGFGFQVVTSASTSCGTITAEYGETKNQAPIVAHPTKEGTYRYFTLAEGYRLFGLKTDYRLPAAKTFAWRMLGQAVFVPLFEAIIRRATARSCEPAAPAEADFPLFPGGLAAAGSA